LRKHSGVCDVFIHLNNSEKTDTIIALPDTIRIKASESLMKEINTMAGYRAVQTEFKGPSSGVHGNHNSKFNRNQGR
jgi:hypothetical protein